MFVPARFRDLLGKEFYVTITPEQCLQIYPQDRWEAVLDKLRLMTQQEQRKLRQLFSKAVQCVPDAQGRIQIPQELRDRVGLVKDVTVVGTGLQAQIWDTETWKSIEEMEDDSENIEKAMEELGF